MAYTKDITLKKNNIYANIEQVSNSTIQYKPTTIIASDFNEIGVDEYLGNNINNLSNSLSVTVAILNGNVVEFKYDTVANLKNVANIKKIFSKQLTEQEKSIITNIMQGNIILKNNIVYVENINEVE